MTRADALRALIDRQAIEACITAHSRGRDRFDDTTLRATYHPGAQVDFGAFRDSAAAFADGLAARPVKTTAWHRVSNILVALAGDLADAETVCIAYVETGDAAAPMQRMFGGRYLDRLSRRDGRWAIDDRRFVLDWNVNRPGSPVWPPAIPRGRHGADDPGTALLAAAAHWLKEDRRMTATPVTDDDVASLIARHALHDLVAYYSRAADRADATALAALFHPDATVSIAGFTGPAPAFAAHLCADLRQNAARAAQSASNHLFHIAGDRATGESYVLAIRTSRTSPARDRIAAGRYLDRFEKRDGVWKFAARTYVEDWDSDEPSTGRYDDAMYGAYAKGGFAPDDPVCDFWPA